jgi:hypothetical protein
MVDPANVRFRITHPDTLESYDLVGEHAESEWKNNYQLRGFKRVGETVGAEEDVDVAPSRPKTVAPVEVPNGEKNGKRSN